MMSINKAGRGVASILATALFVSACRDATPKTAAPVTVTPPSTVPVTVSAPEVPGLPLHESSDITFPPVHTDIDLSTCTLTVSADNRVLQFDRNSAELPRSGPGHDQLLDLIDKFETAESVQIIGYTSYSDGTTEYNLDLSHRRAEAVAAVFAARLPDVDHDVISRGGADPVSTEDGTESSRIPNRRVVLTGKIASRKCTGN